MEKIYEILKKSEEYLLGIIHEKASNKELEEIVRSRLDN